MSLLPRDIQPNEPLAKAIATQNPLIVAAWVERVRAEIEASGSQTDDYLIDHAPRLLKSLADSFNEATNPHAIVEVIENAKAHALQRTRSAYSSSDLIAEYLILREVTLEIVSRIHPLTPIEVLAVTRIFGGALGSSAAEFAVVRKSPRVETDVEQLVEYITGHGAETKIVPYKKGDSLKTANDVLKAERSLAAAREDLKVISDAVLTLLIRVDQEFRYVFVNRAYEAWFGRSAATVLGHKILEFVPTAMSRLIDEHLGRAISGEASSFEHQLTSQEGTTKHFLLTFAPTRETSGRVTGAVITLQDIEQQKRAELDAQERRNELVNVFSQAPYPIALMMGPEHVFTLANPPYIDYVGRNPIGRKVRAVFTDAEATEFFKLLDRVYETGEAYHGRELPLRLATDNGGFDERFVNVSYYPYRSHEGKVVGILAFVTDVTQHVRAREALNATESRMRSIFAHASVGFAVSDVAGRFLDVNPRFCEITGYSADELKKLSVLDIVHKGDLQMDRAKLDELISKKIDSFVIEKRFLKKDGSIAWVRNSVSLLPTASSELHIIRVAEDVTAIRDAEASRRESEENFNFLADSMPQIVWTAKPDGEVDYFNEVWFTYTGTNFADSGFTWGDAIHPDDRDRALAAWQRSVADGTLYNTEIRLRGADGKYRWFVSRAKPTKNKNGKIKKWYGTNTDVHDFKVLNERLATATDNLENERQKFRTLVADANTAMAVLIGPDLVYEIVNQSYAKLFENRDLVGRPLIEALPELEGQKFPILLRRAFEAGEVYREIEAFARLRRTSDGALEDRYFDQSYTPIFDRENKPYGVFIQAVDVTDRVSARRRFEETAERLRIAVEAANMGTWEYDPRTGFIDWSSRTKILFGLSEDVTTLETAIQRVHPEDRERVAREINNALDPYGTRTYNIEYRVLRDDGQTNWVSLLGRSFYEETPAGRVTTKFSGTVLDVTDRVQNEVALRDAKERAELASAAKSSFLANMSHEIRTPLGAIMGFVSLIKDEAVTPQAMSEYVNVIDRNSVQLMRIIDDILDLSKVEAGMMLIEEIDFSLVELLSDFASLMGFRAREKGILFELKARTELPDIVTSDPTRIRQILTNIVGNAIKFTDRGSVLLNVEFKDGELRFDVQDTGRGIANDQISKLFQPFSQGDASTTRKYGGTGLGLVLTRRLAEALGGKFDLKESEQNVGSRFLATVKIKRPESSRFVRALGFESEPIRNAGAQNLLSGLRILLVEDSPDNQALFSIYLNRAGAKIDIAGDGAKGVDMALRDRYDVILMDVQMPIMDGISAVKLLRAKGYDQPIIALTAHAMKEERQRCLEAGYTSFLSKPIQRSELVNALLKFHN